jgi:Carbohydrate family 9 binding domain-like
MRHSILLLIFPVLFYSCSVNTKMTKNSLLKGTYPTSSIQLSVVQVNDFSINGKGDNAEWDKAKWNNLSKLDTGGRSYESKFKIIYSKTGIYVLFSGEDDMISTKEYNDLESIYNGDVFEIFFLPSPLTPVYFEYEINQMRKELILTLSKTSDQLYSWAPRYPSIEEKKPIKKQVNVTGGRAEVGGSIKAWTAEIFLPYTILSLLPNVPPTKGTIWTANFCRLDYDSGKMIKYSWTPTIIKSFHEIEKFQSVRFE